MMLLKYGILKNRDKMDTKLNATAYATRFGGRSLRFDVTSQILTVDGGAQHTAKSLSEFKGKGRQNPIIAFFDVCSIGTRQSLNRWQYKFKQVVTTITVNK